MRPDASWEIQRHGVKCYRLYGALQCGSQKLFRCPRWLSNDIEMNKGHIGVWWPGCTPLFDTLSLQPAQLFFLFLPIFCSMWLCLQICAFFFFFLLKNVPYSFYCLSKKIGILFVNLVVKIKLKISFSSFFPFLSSFFALPSFSSLSSFSSPRTDTSVAQWTPCAFSPFADLDGTCTVFSVWKKC